MYCTGWVGTGPIGVINDTMMSAMDTGRIVLQDLQNIAPCELKKRNQVLEKIQNKGIAATVIPH